MADVIDGFLNESGAQSPVLDSRSFIDAITRDASVGPLTVRPVP
ncbi:hypothetical protein [Mycobacterium sp. E2733]|nr:hypothetical protein [Mycobacterium sp. E2733]